MSNIIKSISKDKTPSPGNSQQASSANIGRWPEIVSYAATVDINSARGSNSKEPLLKNTDVPKTPFELEWIACEPDIVYKKVDPTKGAINNKNSISANTKNLLKLKSTIMDPSAKQPPPIPKTLPAGKVPLSKTDTSPSSSSSLSHVIEPMLKRDTSVIDVDIGERDQDDGISRQVLDGQIPDCIEPKRKNDHYELDEPIVETLLRDLRGIYSKMKIIVLPLSSYDTYRIALREWDLWGPLILCTFLAFNLHHPESLDQHSGPHFAEIFVLIWFGSCTISLNYRLLSVTSSVNRNHISNESITSSHQPSPSINNVGNMLFPGNDNAQQEQSKYDQSSQFQERSKQQRNLIAPPSIFQLMCVFGYCLVPPCFGLILLKIFSISLDFSLRALFFEKLVIGMVFGFLWPTFCSVKILVRYQERDKRALAIYPIGLFYFILSWMIILNH